MPPQGSPAPLPPSFPAHRESTKSRPPRPFVDKRSCSCRSSRPFATLRDPSRPFADKKMLQLPFFVALRGPSWTKGCCSCSCRSSWSFVALRGQKEVAVAVLRDPSRPFADKKMLQLPFFVVLRGPSWTKGCCSCRSSWSFEALRGQKEVAVAVLRDPSRPFADKKMLQLPFLAPLRGQNVLPCLPAGHAHTTSRNR